jgi:radical SAM superfamily enzyme YgiQ (UPF0313 family)
MRVLLINPPNYHAAKSSSGWDVGIDNIGVYPPMGLLHMASYMRAHTDCEVRILDAIVDKLSYEQIRDYAREFKPDLVGVTSFTLTFYDVMQTIKAVKKACPKTHICVGGPHTVFWSEEIASKPEVDSVLRGECDITFTKLARALDRGEDITKVGGIVVEKEGRIIKNDEVGIVKNLDELPPPAFELVPYKKYYSLNSKEKSIAVIISSRGCPFRCSYCEVFNKIYRKRSVDNIMEEIKTYYGKGIREFLFFDDLFNITPQRVIEVSERIIEEGLKIRWTFRGRVDQVTEEMVAAAKKAGCTLISFGIEDYTDEGLRRINKNITTEQVLRAINIVKKHGIETSTNWIIGLPWHKSERDVMELLKFAKKVDSTYAEFTILVPCYGTQIYKEGVKKGVLKEGVWREYAKNPKPDFFIPLWEEHLNREKLSYLYHKCYLGYYYRPSYILRSLLKTKSPRELCRKALAALKVLGITSRVGGR